jgi:vancomycin resistance protein YoaR
VGETAHTPGDYRLQHVRRATNSARQAESPVTLNLPPRAAAVGLGVLLILGVISSYTYVSAHADRVFPGVRAAGVPLDGLAPDTAQRLIAERAGALAGTRVQVRAGESTWSPTLGELGLQTDPADLTRRAFAVGRAGSPLDRGTALFGGLVRPQSVGGGQIARARLQEWVAAAAREHDRPAVDARVEIGADGRVVLWPEQVGRRLDQPGALTALDRALDGWADGSAARETFSSVLLPTESAAPRVTASDLAPVRDEAARSLAQPIVARAGADRIAIQPAEVAPLLRVQGDGLTIDPAATTALIERIAAQVDRAPRDATLAIGRDGSVRYEADVAGRRLERAAAAASLATAVKAADGAELALPVEALPASVRAEHLAEARAGAERALGGPVELRAGDKSLALDGPSVAALLRVDGSTLKVDASPLRPRLEELAKVVDRAPKHGRLMIEGGGRTPAGAVAALPGGGAEAQVTAIEEGIPGLTLDVEAALALIGPRLTAGERTLALPTKEAPAYTSRDRAALGALTLLQWGTTDYSGGLPERGHNIEHAARQINGTVVPPGETFSFNRATGPTTIDTGYKVSWGIMGGEQPGAPPRTVPSVGGGICQVATTLFHAVFWSGFQIDERHWHLYWIPKYGAPPKGLKGLDATVDEPSGTDLQWTNNSAHPVIVQARTDGARISFGLYGTDPGWKVAVSEPVIDRFQPTTGAVVQQRDPSKPASYRLKVEEARDGFRSTIVRTVTAADGQVRRAAFVSDYVPSRHVWIVGG